jgi:signal transduction histidine kinase
MLRRLFVICWFCILTVLGNSQWPKTDQMLHVSVKDGLSDNYIRHLSEDPHGFIWMATANGLNRYNGSEITSYFTTNSQLPSNNIYQVKPIPQNRLLLGTGAGVAIMDALTGKIQVFNIDKKDPLYQYANEVERVFMTPDGYILASTKTGVYVLDKNGEIIKSLEAGFKESDVAVRRIYFVLNMDMFNNGDAIMATTQGYFYYHHNSKTFEAIETSTKATLQNFRSFIINRKSSYIFNINNKDQLFFIDFKSATADTIFVFDFRNEKIHHVALGVQPNTNFRWDAIIGFHSDSLITITTNRNGLYFAILDTANFRWHIPPFRSLTTSNNRNILRTSDNRWLVGSESGLLVQSFWKDQIRVINFNQWIDPKRPQPVGTILKFQDKLWVGFNSSTEALLVLDTQYNLIKSIKIRGLLNKYDNNKVRWLMPWQGDSILAGTAVGLYVVHTKNYSVTPFEKGRSIPGFPSIQVGAFFRDKQNYLWVSLAGKGVHRYDPTTGTSLHFLPGEGSAKIPLRYVHAYAEDKKGNIWMVHRTDGMVRWNPKTETFDKIIRKWPGMGTDFDCTGIIAHDDGSIWCFINSKGLFRYDPETNKLIHEAIINDRGEEETQTMSIAPKGQLWMNLRHSICVYDTLSKDLKIIGSKQGLPDEFNTGFSLGYNASEEIIYAGFHNKVMMLQSDIKRQFSKFRGPYITGIKSLADQSLQDFSKPFSLSYKNNSIRIDVSYVEFDAGRKLPLEYRLIRDKQENGWIGLYDQSNIYISNLAPGNYTFEVRPAVAQSTKEEAPISARFTISPPFTQTLLFKLLAIITVLSIFYALYRYRLKQALRIQALRTSISGDLHDDIGSRLTQIRFLNVMAKQKLGNPAETERMLKKMEDEIISSGEALDEIVWNMKAGDATLGTIVARMRRYADAYFEDDNIEMVLSAENIPDNFIMQAEQRKDLFLIFRELLTNIRKHAKASTVEVILRLENNILQMEVTDNGKGFDVTEPTVRNGLILLKHRLSKWGGHADIISSPGKGTKVKITWPLGRFSPLKSIFS